jgi:hypothetical protein
MQQRAENASRLHAGVHPKQDEKDLPAVKRTIRKVNHNFSPIAFESSINRFIPNHQSWQLGAAAFNR